MTNLYRLDTRDKPALLFTMLRVFASDQSRVAFEGNLANTELFRMEGASHEETEKLKRATTAPQLDFVVLPLTLDRVSEIERAIQSKIAFSGYRGIVHVQIERNEELVFGAYDNFDRDAVVVDGIPSVDLLDQLVSDRTLRSYAAKSTLPS
ncbi:hypothetical protein [Occallatibacter riparius]|uniref:Uncharacterized protein n=1 Tax=Occallatibacter riparius TaxID=1002689 RepID=A0A9J7BG24_9BACT|nr:hypothetical protein [Occallatibacter riparius]UWZ81728.1 hypothetical protein MOP44_14155 [Occallatibacter riparius]